MSTIETSKQDLINSLKERVEDGIIEQANADLLIKLIEKADSLTEAINIAELGTTYKRTGFHFDKRLEKIGDTIKYLKKNGDLSFSDGSDAPHHKLIIGDNYDALQNLLVEYKGKIDVIYIDPPYGKDDMGSFADTNYDNSITRDNLLSMLYPRLMLARHLISDDGVIFCSIDDKNQAYVKGLFDEVFGEKNMISCICREAIKGGSKTNNIKKVHDYVLTYGKQLFESGKEKILLNGAEFIEEQDYKYEDEKGSFAKGRELNKWGAGSRREDSPSMWFPIYTPDGEEVYPIRTDGSEGRWRWGKRKLLKALEAGNVLFERREDGVMVAYEKIREDKTKNQQLISFLKGDYINAKGTSTIKDVMGGLMSIFDYAKPVELIKELVKYYPEDNCIVLDFFAGTGTTGQAVLELNKEDDGARKFILCTNNEITNLNPNGIALDVTSKRLKRVMTGSCYDGTSDFKWTEDNEPLGGSLDVYDIATVANFEQGEGRTPFDVIDETAYGLSPFEKPEDKIKWVCENFDNTQKYLEDK